MVISSTAPITSDDSAILHTEVINLPEQMELVDGKLIKKTGMTFKQSNKKPETVQ